MSDDILKANITIEETSSKDKKISIKGIPQGSDKALKFSFWQEKKDGTPSKAYTQYIKNNPQPGQMVGVAYKDNPGEYEGKKFMYHNIMWFEPAGEIEEVRDIPGIGPEDLETAPMATGEVSELPEGAVLEGQELLEPLRLVYKMVEENNAMLKELVLREEQVKVDGKTIDF